MVSVSFQNAIGLHSMKDTLGIETNPFGRPFRAGSWGRGHPGLKMAWAVLSSPFGRKNVQTPVARSARPRLRRPRRARQLWIHPTETCGRDVGSAFAKPETGFAESGYDRLVRERSSYPLARFSTVCYAFMSRGFACSARSKIFIAFPELLNF